MATGDINDIAARMRSVLPGSWFPSPNSDGTSNTPILDAVLIGLAWPWAQFYSLLLFVQLQTRIATASGSFLDMIAQDYLGNRTFRHPGQGDNAFRAAIVAEILRPRVTRAALVQTIINLTGRTPIVFEPIRPADTGGYGFQGMFQGTGLAYGSADGTVPASVPGAAGSIVNPSTAQVSPGPGGWGSLLLPFQVFITAYRAIGGGIAQVGGYYTGTGWAGGGYGVGALEWAELSQSLGQITDADIDNAIVAVLPVGTTAWTRVSN